MNCVLQQFEHFPCVKLQNRVNYNMWSYFSSSGSVGQGRKQEEKLTALSRKVKMSFSRYRETSRTFEAEFNNSVCAVFQKSGV